MRVHARNRRTYTARVKACAACGAANPEGARFCVQCGAVLAAPCANCGAEIPEGARFCPACGRRVEPAAEAGEERKVVSILFSDVAGSTALGERLDPERLKEVIGAYFEAMRREIEAEGGTVEKFVGDAVMAVFGVPVAHEDDPRRALRAALRMRGALGELNRRLEHEHGVTLAMRTGVNTGEVVAETAPRAGQGMVAGDAVNVAARLEQAAESGQILVSERTARSARGLVFRSLGPVSLKGKEEPVRVFELVEEGEVPPPGLRHGERAREHPAPMVGRGRELDLLRAVFERACSERRTHLVTIYGEPGVGKTRLVEEFEGWAAGLAEPPLVLRGRCLPYGEGVTYWPLAEILKGEAGVLDSDAPDLALEKVHKVAGAVLAEVPGLSEDPDRSVATLAFTVGLADPSHPLEEHEPHMVRAAVHEAWRSYFWALAHRGPVLVEVEDIHWGDPALLDLLEELAERCDGPLLFVCSARHELTLRRSGWGGGRRNFSSVLLDPLGDAEARRLLDLLLGEEDVGEALRERILDRAGGNPFFLEEIVRHVVEERRTVAAEAGWRAATEMEEVEIPDTVQGVLAARMDLLLPAEKRILQSAAVVGRVFWTGPVGTLLEEPAPPQDVLDALARLQERGLVHARVGSSIEGEREYAFRHILTRDVAYESLPRRDRATKHALVADWLESRAGRQTEFAELLAHHYAEAHRGLAAEARSDPAEVERVRRLAFRFALIAANEARARLVLEQAERFAESALALAAGPGDRSDAMEALGMSYLHDTRGDMAWQCLKEAIDLREGEAGEDGRAGEDDAPSMARLCAEALEVATRHRGVMRRRLPKEEVEPYLAIGLANVEDGDSEERARLLVAKAFWPYAFHDMDLSEEAMEQSRATAEEAAAMAFRLGRLPLASAALDAVSSTYHLLGRYGPMGGPIGRRLELAPLLSDPWELGDIHAVAAWCALNTGRYREAARLASVGMDHALPGSRIMGLYCLDFRAVARLRLGEWDGVLADVALADEILGDRRTAPPGFASMHLAAAAFIHEIRGDQAAANRYLQLVDWLEKTEERPDLSWTLWRSRTLARRGDFVEARDLLARPVIAGDLRGRDEFLEAWCEVIAEQGAWEEAARLVEEARRHAAWAGVPPLSVYADRLEGRAALAAGEAETAASLLMRATEGFAGLEAEWEAAVTRLDRAGAEALAGRADEARASVERAVPTLDRLRSLRELVRAGELLDRLS
jgi:class 3 adenylate cyclase/tetratricopeptide (TPR) repeat protein